MLQGQITPESDRARHTVAERGHRENNIECVTFSIKFEILAEKDPCTFFLQAAVQAAPTRPSATQLYDCWLIPLYCGLEFLQKEKEQHYTKGMRDVHSFIPANKQSKIPLYINLCCLVGLMTYKHGRHARPVEILGAKSA